MLIPTLQATKVSRGEETLPRRTRSLSCEQFERLWKIWDTVRKSRAVRPLRPKTQRPPTTSRHRGRFGSWVTPRTAMEDFATLEMLRNLLDPLQWELDMPAPETLTAELLDQVAEQQPALLCLVATPPGGLAHTRYLCKRLRARFPDLKVLVCRWNGTATSESNARYLRETGADVVATTLLETRQQLTSLLPVLTQMQRHDQSAGVPGGPLQQTEETSAGT